MFAVLWQVNKLFASLQAFVQKCKVGLAGLDKSRCIFELGQAACGLHIGKYRTAFAHGDVVRRVKAQRCNVAKGAYYLATVGGA